MEFLTSKSNRGLNWVDLNNKENEKGITLFTDIKKLYLKLNSKNKQSFNLWRSHINGDYSWIGKPYKYQIIFFKEIELTKNSIQADIKLDDEEREKRVNSLVKLQKDIKKLYPEVLPGSILVLNELKCYK